MFYKAFISDLYTSLKMIDKSDNASKFQSLNKEVNP
jgi:hypothetical protein